MINGGSIKVRAGEKCIVPRHLGEAVFGQT